MTKQMTFKTKKAAREAGWKTRTEWMRRDYEKMVPIRNAIPVIVKGEEFFPIEACEHLFSMTSAKKCGLVLRDDAEFELIAHSQINGKSVSYPMYRESDFRSARKVKLIPAQEIDLLLAIFTVNKSAKRYRDAARSLYRSRAWGLATWNREKKEHLYQLKEKGISAAYRSGLLNFAGPHGGMVKYVGGGYSFHSALLPKDKIGEPSDSSPIFIESAPKSASEARLKDAELTLSKLPKVHPSFERIESGLVA